MINSESFFCQACSSVDSSADPLPSSSRDKVDDHKGCHWARQDQSLQCFNGMLPTKVCALAVQHGVQPLHLLFSQTPCCAVRSRLRHLNQTHIGCFTSSTNTCPYPDASHPLLTVHHSSDVITLHFIHKPIFSMHYNHSPTLVPPAL